MFDSSAFQVKNADIPERRPTMNILSNDEQFVLQLFGLENEDVQSIQYMPAGDIAMVDITLAPHPIKCPECSYDSPKVKNYVLKKIRHSELTDRACILRYHARRFVCPVCGRTYYEANPFVFKVTNHQLCWWFDFSFALQAHFYVSA